MSEAVEVRLLLERDGQGLQGVLLEVDERSFEVFLEFMVAFGQLAFAGAAYLLEGSDVIGGFDFPFAFSVPACHGYSGEVRIPRCRKIDRGVEQKNRVGSMSRRTNREEDVGTDGRVEVERLQDWSRKRLSLVPS